MTFVDVASLVIVVLSLLFVALYQWRLCNICEQSRDASIVVPMTRTFCDILSVGTDQDAKQMMGVLEASKFRSFSITVFDSVGDIVVDSVSPVGSRGSMPPTQRHADLFSAVSGKDDSKESSRVITGSLFRSCHPKGGEKSTTVFAAMKIRDGAYTVVVCSCGHEQV